MHRLNSLKQHRASHGRQPFRLSRRELHVQCLHKALRTPSAGPITAPADVVYECLTLLRRPDLESLVPFFPAVSFDPRVRRVGLVVGGEVVEEAGPLACCNSFMDTAARRVLPGHLLRRCRVLSSVQLPGGTCQLRVALTARTGEESVFLWRLRRLGGQWGEREGERHAADAVGPVLSSGPTLSPPQEEDPGPGPQSRGSQGSGPSGSYDSKRGGECSSSTSNEDVDGGSEWGTEGAGFIGQGLGGGEAAGGGGGTISSQPLASGANGRPPRPAAPAPAASGHAAAAHMGAPARPDLPTSTGSVPQPTAAAAEPPAVKQQQPQQQPAAKVVAGGVTGTTWVVESVLRDGSHDEEEMPAPGPAGGRGPHPRASPEQVVKAQLAALRRGDVAGAASYNLWSRSTSGGWDLHLSAFRALLRQPSYHVLMTSDGAELGPSALPSMRRMVQEVRLLPPPPGTGLGSSAAAGGGWRMHDSSSGGRSFVFKLCMQANGCWLVEAIRALG